MKRILNICLLLSSLIGYLEWGKGMHAFLFQTEYDLIFKKSPESQTFLHPFVLVPLIGQLMLLITAFQKRPSRILTLLGLSCLSILMLFIFLIGVMGGNIRIAMSAVPFIITGIFVLRYNRKRTPKS